MGGGCEGPCRAGRAHCRPQRGHPAKHGAQAPVSIQGAPEAAEGLPQIPGHPSSLHPLSIQRAGHTPHPWPWSQISCQGPSLCHQGNHSCVLWPVMWLRKSDLPTNISKLPNPQKNPFQLLSETSQTCHAGPVFLHGNTAASGFPGHAPGTWHMQSGSPTASGHLPTQTTPPQGPSTLNLRQRQPYPWGCVCVGGCHIGLCGPSGFRWSPSPFPRSDHTGNSRGPRPAYPCLTGRSHPLRGHSG